MCDADYSYEHISDRWLITRKKHECASCLQDFPAGTRMNRRCGKTDGDFGSYYCCAACEFAFMQEDETVLHLCWGWNWDGPYNDEHGFAEERWQYINDTLAIGETPTVEGVTAVIEAAKKAEAEE